MVAAQLLLLTTGFALLVFLPQTLRAAHVMVVFPVGATSHWNLGRAIARGLHAHGHRITAVTAFPGQGPPHNWTDVAVTNTIHFFGQTSGLFELGKINGFKMFMKMIQYGTYSCEVYLQDEGVKDLLKSDDKFDVMIVEVFFCECFLAVAHKLGIPVIAFATFSPPAWMGDIVGNPSAYAYVPDSFLGFSDHLTFYERLVNSAYGTFTRVARRMLLIPQQEALVRRYLNDTTIPGLLDLDRNTSLLLTNSHFSIMYTRPLLPNMVEVGGMHISPPKKLPKDLQEFLDDAQDGAILFSLGSNLKSADLPQEKVSAFVNAFSKLKERVLWKWETESFPGKPDNLKLGKWLPQSDILAHKDIKLFITHGGLLSTLEAMYHGVPVIGIPIFGDQELNMKQAVNKGYGLRLRFSNITTDTLLWTIREILDNPRFPVASTCDNVRRMASYDITCPRYRMKAQELSRLYHDRPRSPLEEVVYWTEYVVRHKGAPHMRCAAQDLAWYQYLLLDVAAGVLGGAAIAVWLVVVLLKTVLRLAFGVGSKATVNCLTGQQKKQQ